MKLLPEGSSFPDFRSSNPSERIPSASQSVVNASAYTPVSEQQHLSSFSSQCPPHDSISQYYTNDAHHNQTSTQAIATSYPESSQRTIMHNPPYQLDYDKRDFQCSDIGNDQATVYTNLGDSDLDHIPPDLTSATGCRQRMSELDVHHFQQDSSAAPPSHHHFEYGPNLATTGERTSHHMSSKLTYPTRETSRAPSAVSKRRNLPKAVGLQARHRPGHGPEDLLYPRNLNRESVYLHSSNIASLPLLLPSIPMSNNPGESQASLNPSYEPTHCSSDGFACATSDRESLASIRSHEVLDEFSSSSVSKKRRSKMHECEVCGKMFPRPSGLQTHMNTHNNVKPFPCGFPGCDRTFTVRSNAKRHLRIHGVVPVSSIPEPPPAPYVIDFSAPTVMGSSDPTPQIINAPLKLRWMPPSLTSRTNVQNLRSLSDEESDSDDPDANRTNLKWRSGLSIPLRAVVPSLYTDDEFYEERNSYLDAKAYPYHPSQFHILPGPAASNPRSQSVV